MQAACDRRSNAARRTGTSSDGAAPRTPRDRSAGTPRAPLRVREARMCAPRRHPVRFPGKPFVWPGARREHAGGM